MIYVYTIHPSPSEGASRTSFSSLCLSHTEPCVPVPDAMPWGPLSQGGNGWHSDDEKNTWTCGRKHKGLAPKNAIKNHTLKRESILICLNDISNTMLGPASASPKVSMTCLVQLCTCLGYHLESRPPKISKVVWASFIFVRENNLPEMINYYWPQIGDHGNQHPQTNDHGIPQIPKKKGYLVKSFQEAKTFPPKWIDDSKCFFSFLQFTSWSDSYIQKLMG